MNKVPLIPIKKKDTEGSALSQFIAEPPKPTQKPQANPSKTQSEKN